MPFGSDTYPKEVLLKNLDFEQIIARRFLIKAGNVADTTVRAVNAAVTSPLLVGFIFVIF